VTSDNRDWSKYNDALVRRGEILLDFSTINNWKQELKQLNKGKVGEPYHYPNSLIMLLGLIRILYHLPYRQLEGFIRALAKYVEGLQAPDYTTICRRINKLNINLEETLLKSTNPVSLAVDSSGIKVHNGGDWIRKVWKVKKGYLKIHFAVNTKTKQIVSMHVTSEKVHDGKVLRRLVRGAMKSVKVRRVLADGAYDSRENFNFLSQSGIKPVIRVRVNSVARSMGCPSRRDTVLEQRALGPRAWSRVHRFGFRWVVEGVFSVVKRVFGEYVLARKFVNMVKEVLMKAYLYNIFVALTSS